MMGIDGCRYGWCVAHGSDRPEITLLKSIQEIDSIVQHKQVLIDLPMGLPDKDHTREVEIASRKLLNGRASSIFTIPCRQSIYADDYASANILNRKELGKGLSIQSWNICAKIKEVDQYLRSMKSQRQLLEAHPELCFQYLNRRQELLPSKKTKEGRVKRVEILNSWLPELQDIYESEQKKFLRKEAQLDDILDAMCLWLVNYLSEEHSIVTVHEDRLDANGIKMNIHFVNPNAYEV